MADARPLRAAVVGAGVFGGYHADKYAASPNAELVAVVDANPDRAAEIAAKHGAQALTDHADLPDDVEVVSVATPTRFHHGVGMDLIARGMNLLIEKPIASTEALGLALAEAAEARGVVLQVGHIERFSSAFDAIMEVVRRPVYIQSERIAAFTGRSTDVNVVLDLMIHDIDLVIALVNAPITAVEAVGAPILTPTDDIANARIAFANGCIANISASRISHKTERKLRIFQTNDYVVADLASRHLWRISREVNDRGQPSLKAFDKPLERNDSLMAEIESFIAAVRTGTRPRVDGRDGVAALRAALQIGESLTRHREWVSSMLTDAERAEREPAP